MKVVDVREAKFGNVAVQILWNFLIEVNFEIPRHELDIPFSEIGGPAFGAPGILQNGLLGRCAGMKGGKLAGRAQRREKMRLQFATRPLA